MDGYTEYLDGLNREKTIEIDRLETALDGNSKLIADMSAQLTALESDNARLRERADAAAGLREALQQIVEMPSLSKQSPIHWNGWAKEIARAALAAYKQAQGKGE
jgi:hypothetical protein